MSDFSNSDYLQLKGEIDYLKYIHNNLDGNDLAEVGEKIAVAERIEYLEDLLEKWRIVKRREGFELIDGGKA